MNVAEATSEDTLQFIFSLGNAEINSVDVTKNGRWDEMDKSATFDFSLLAEWDSVTIRQRGKDGGNDGAGRVVEV